MGGCVRITLKKYAKRPSPPFHAGDCKGETKKGNDGRIYTSVPDKRGVYTWKVSGNAPKTRKAPKGRMYEIHDNGGRPFKVYVNKANKTIHVYKHNWEDNSDTLINEWKYKEIWIGSDPHAFGLDADDPRFKGNSILVQLTASKYMFIGWNIYTFELMEGDEPLKYYSPVGSNDVPYPYLIGKTHTYFMIEYTAVPNTYLDLSREAYEQLYGHNPGPLGSVDKVAKKMKYTIVHKRLLG